MSSNYSLLKNTWTVREKYDTNISNAISNAVSNLNLITNTSTSVTLAPGSLTSQILKIDTTDPKSQFFGISTDSLFTMWCLCDARVQLSGCIISKTSDAIISKGITTYFAKPSIMSKYIMDVYKIKNIFAPMGDLFKASNKFATYILEKLTNKEIFKTLSRLGSSTMKELSMSVFPVFDLIGGAGMIVDIIDMTGTKVGSKIYSQMLSFEDFYDLKKQFNDDFEKQLLSQGIDPKTIIDKSEPIKNFLIMNYFILNNPSWTTDFISNKSNYPKSSDASKLFFSMNLKNSNLSDPLNSPLYNDPCYDQYRQIFDSYIINKITAFQLNNPKQYQDIYKRIVRESSSTLIDFCKSNNGVINNDSDGYFSSCGYAQNDCIEGVAYKYSNLTNSTGPHDIYGEWKNGACRISDPSMYILTKQSSAPVTYDPNLTVCDSNNSNCVTGLPVSNSQYCFYYGLDYAPNSNIHDSNKNPINDCKMNLMQEGLGFIIGNTAVQELTNQEYNATKTYLTNYIGDTTKLLKTAASSCAKDNTSYVINSNAVGPGNQCMYDPGDHVYRVCNPVPNSTFPQCTVSTPLKCMSGFTPTTVNGTQYCVSDNLGKVCVGDTTFSPYATLYDKNGNCTIKAENNCAPNYTLTAHPTPDQLNLISTGGLQDYSKMPKSCDYSAKNQTCVPTIKAGLVTVYDSKGNCIPSTPIQCMDPKNTSLRYDSANGNQPYCADVSKTLSFSPYAFSNIGNIGTQFAKTQINTTSSTGSSASSISSGLSNMNSNMNTNVGGGCSIM